MAAKKNSNAASKKIPIGKNEDVEFNEGLADSDDIEAKQRAAAADKRAEK